MIQNDRQRKERDGEKKGPADNHERKADKEDLKHCVIVFRLVHCFKPYTRHVYDTVYCILYTLYVFIACSNLIGFSLRIRIDIIKMFS